MENLYVMKKLEDTVKLLECSIADMMKTKEKVIKLEACRGKRQAAGYAS